MVSCQPTWLLGQHGSTTSKMLVLSQRRRCSTWQTHELNAVGWLKQGLIVNKPVVLEYTPGQGKFQGIRESASGIPRGISFATETRFHQTQDILQEKGIPSAIQRVLQIVDPQLQLLCGSRRNVMANLCRETVANLGAKFALHFLDFPAQGCCLISFLKALHLEFVAYRASSSLNSSL